LVIRYDYLWSDDRVAGREAAKDRPACLVAASDPSPMPRFVVILPITHARPARGTAGIEVPAAVRRAIGLDDAPCWVIVSEHNVDEWPNAGLRHLPGKPGVFDYGFIPPRLFAQVKATFLELAKRGGRSSIQRYPEKRLTLHANGGNSNSTPSSPLSPCAKPAGNKNDFLQTNPI